MQAFKKIIESGDEKRIKNFLFYNHDYNSYRYTDNGNEDFNEYCMNEFKTLNNLYNYFSKYLNDEIVESIITNCNNLDNAIFSSIILYYNNRSIIENNLKNYKEFHMLNDGLYNHDELFELLKIIIKNVNIDILNNYDYLIDYISDIINNCRKKKKEIVLTRCRELFSKLDDNSINIDRIKDENKELVDILIEMNKLKNKDTIHEETRLFNEKEKIRKKIFNFNYNISELVKKYIKKIYKLSSFNTTINIEKNIILEYTKILNNLDDLLNDEIINNEFIKAKNEKNIIQIIINNINDIDNDNIEKYIEKLTLLCN